MYSGMGRELSRGLLSNVNIDLALTKDREA